MNFSINGKVYRFNKVIKNSMSNFISHDSIACDNKNPRYINAKVYKQKR